MADPHPSAAPLDVVAAGYASLDLVYGASAPPAPGRTVLLRGPVTPPPRYGGCGPIAALELARLGCRTGLITWLGDDTDGRRYRDHLQAGGVDTRGVTLAPGRASPRCFLFYDPAGGATCYYHPGASAELCLHAGARALLPGAKLLALTVGPAALTDALLDARSPETRVAWNVKADPHAYPLPLRRRLLDAAEIVCLNRDEIAFAAEPLPLADEPDPADADRALDALVRATGGTVVLTAGADGCRVAWPGGRTDVPAEPVSVTDPTGAGDTFFAAFVAASLQGVGPVDAARSATARTRAFLLDRTRDHPEAGR